MTSTREVMDQVDTGRPVVVPKATPPTNSFARRMVANSVWNLVAYIAATIIGIASIPLYIRMLGLQHYGLVVILNSILVPIGLLNLSFGEATVKYVAESIGRGDVKQAIVYVRTTLLVNLVGGVLGMVLIASLAHLLSTRFFAIDPADQQLAETAFYWVAASWLVSEISSTYMGVPIALQRYGIVALGNSLGSTLSIVVSLVTLALGGNVLTLMQVRLVWNIVVTVFWALSARALLPNLSLLPGWNRQAFRQSASFGFWQTVASLGSLFGNQSDKFVLGYYLSTAAVGLYNIAFTVELTIYAAIYKLADVIFPAISNLQGRGEDTRAGQLMLRSGWLLSLLTVVGLGSMAVCAHDVLRLYLGIEVADAVAWLLQVLCIAGMLSSGSVSVSQYLMGTGKTQWMAITTIASGLIVLIGGLLLVSRYGLAGIGWTQILAVVLTRPIVHYYLWRAFLRDTIPGRVFFSYLYGPATIGVALTLCLSLLYAQIGWPLGMFGLFMLGAICAGMLLGGIIAVDTLLPGAWQRRADLRALLVLAQTRFLRLVRRRRVLTGSV